jgi:hypothetical protein
VKEFKKGFHKFLVAITLMAGSMYLSTWVYYFIKNIIPFFFKVDIYEPFPWMFQMIAFTYIARKTAYYTDFRYKE